MKYNAHLNTGAVIPIELSEVPRVAILIRGGWLVGETGTMIQMDAVVAMVPATPTPTAPATELPEHVHDGEGDLWTRNDAGTYDYRSPDGMMITRSLDRIARTFGLAKADE